MSDRAATGTQPERISLKPLVRALLRSQWQQQRWQVVLAGVVMAVLMAGTVRAQLVSMHEAAAGILWIGGYVLAAFLAITPIGGERANDTWEHLTALPAPRAAVILAKWLFGVIAIVCIILIATTAGWVAGQGLFLPTGWVLTKGMSVAFGLGAWYILLLLPTLRSRNEYEAAMMVLAVSVIGAVWAMLPCFFLPGLLDRHTLPPAGLGETLLQWAQIAVGLTHPVLCAENIAHVGRRIVRGMVNEDFWRLASFWCGGFLVSTALWWIAPWAILARASRREIRKARAAEGSV